MRNRRLFCPLFLIGKFFLPVSAAILAFGCSSSTTTETGPLQDPNQDSQQPNSNTQPAAETLPDDSFLLMLARRDLVRVSAVTGDSDVLYTYPSVNYTFVGPPDVVGNHVILGDTRNTMNAINLDTGELDWSFRFTATDGSTSAFVCADPVCYAVDAEGLLFAIDVRIASSLQPDDDPLKPLVWYTELNTDITADADSLEHRALLVQGDYIYAATEYGDDDATATLQILDRETGALVHTIALGEIALGVPVIKDGLLLVATLTSIRAYSVDSYDLIWQTDFDGSNGLRGTNEMAVAGDIVVITSNVVNERLAVFVGLNVNTGKALWTTNSGTGDTRFSPQTDGTTIYSMKSELCSAIAFGPCSSGTPIALNPQTGDVLWGEDAKYTAEDEPLVAAGSLYFGELFESEFGSSNRFGFMAIDTATAEINLVAPQVSILYTDTPILVSNGEVFRTNVFPTYIP